MVEVFKLIFDGSHVDDHFKMVVHLNEVGKFVFADCHHARSILSKRKTLSTFN